MAHRTLTRLFFAGTDTDVGKTFVTALVARMLRHAGKRVAVYKPVASGCRTVDGAMIADDAVALWEAAGRPLTLDAVCPQRFLEPLAPPEAAAAEGKTVDAELLQSGATLWEDGFDVLLIEGAGGLLSPLANGVLNIDLVRQLKSSLVIVAANRLGAIHQTLATCAAAKQQGVTPRGILLSDPTGAMEASIASNAAQIERYCDVPILGSVPFGGSEADVASVQKLLS